MASDPRQRSGCAAWAFRPSGNWPRRTPWNCNSSLDAITGSGSKGPPTALMILPSSPTPSPSRSVGRPPSRTDLHPQHDRPALSALFTALCTQVAGDLKRKGYRARTIGIKLRFDDFETVTRDLTLQTSTDAAEVIRGTAGACLKRVPLTRKIRLLGVRASNLCRSDASAPWAEENASHQGALPFSE